MLRTVIGVSCAFALFGSLLVLSSPSQGDEPIVTKDEIAYGLSPKKGPNADELSLKYELSLKKGLAITAVVNLPTVVFEFNSYQLTTRAEM